MKKCFKELVYLSLIAERKMKTALLDAMSESGGRIMHSMYGRGSVRASQLREVFGLVVEENKVLITCLLSREKADIVLQMLVDKFDFNKPNTGVAFTIPVDRLSF